MSTLARLRGETEKIRQGRRVFVSSAPVSAYKVANNKKSLLEGEHPFVLALPADDSGSSFSIVEASVGDLHWTLTSINHVLRTASKYGEPTFLFANILDTDPEAFVAVTLNKRTSGEELEHLEGVISRVCNFHIAETKPMQVPGPDQVLGALGKGLAKLVFGGGSSSSKAKDNTPDTNRQRSSRSPSPRHTDQHQQQQQAAYSWLTPAERERAEQARSEKERFDYLSALEARRGTHVASAGTQGYGASVSRSHHEGDVPTAPKMPVGRSAMGVGSKAETDARLAALKAEMRGEGGAPGVSASYRDTSRTAQQPTGSAYPSIRTDNRRTPPADWQRHQPGTLSNPFTGGGGSNDSSSRERQAPNTISYEDYLGRDEQWGADRHGRSSGQKPSAGGGFYESGVEYTQSGDPVLRSRQQQQYGQQGQYGQQRSSHDDDSDRGSYGAGYMGYSGDRGTADAQHHQQQQLSERDQRRQQYEQEAREAREEWDRAVAARRAAESAPAGPAAAAGSQVAKPRVRYHEGKYDTSPYDDSFAGGWGKGASRGQQPAYAGAGGGWGQAEQGGGGGAGGNKKGPPGWLEMLGKVCAGGPDL